MIFTIMSIILVASSLMAIIIYMISKEYFEDILIETAYYVENSINNIRDFNVNSFNIKLFSYI